MLMALLYTDDDRIAAAAPACDQIPYGDQYWSEFHESEIESHGILETAYVTVANPELRERLLLLGIDESVSGAELAREVDSSAAPEYLPGKAA